MRCAAHPSGEAEELRSLCRTVLAALEDDGDIEAAIAALNTALDEDALTPDYQALGWYVACPSHHDEQAAFLDAPRQGDDRGASQLAAVAEALVAEARAGGVSAWARDMLSALGQAQAPRPEAEPERLPVGTSGRHCDGDLLCNEEVPCSRCGEMCCDYRQSGGERVCILCITKERDAATAHAETMAALLTLTRGERDEAESECARLREQLAAARAERDEARADLTEAREHTAIARRSEAAAYEARVKTRGPATP
ncbi:MAG: hypothetical protein AMXMBFR64_04840 [Myxococcales bacterium]